MGVRVFLVPCSVFLASLGVYVLTLSPGPTLWDGGELALCAEGLDVGHPPGAPLVWLLLGLAVKLGALCGLEPAYSCNLAHAAVTALAAALLALCARELLAHNREPQGEATKLAPCLTAGLSWALFDSVWTNANGVEVYGFAAALAFAMLLTALRFRRAGNPRLLLLFALLAGLAAVVHPLAWTILPAAAFPLLAHTLRRRHWLLRITLPPLLGLAATAALYWLAGGRYHDAGLIADVLAVNSLGLPVGAGLVAAAFLWPLLLLLLAVVTRKSKLFLVPCSLFLATLGFAAQSLVLLRARCNPPVSIARPDDAQRLLDYLHRDMYGPRPWLLGPTCASKPTDVLQETALRLQAGRYVAGQRTVGYEYDSLRWLPRMWDPDSAAVVAACAWAGIDGRETGRQPTLAEELRFLARCQVGHYWLRYLGWNLLGRQNDRLGHGGRLEGNWQSGIAPLDRLHLGHALYEGGEQGATRLWGLPLLLLLAGVMLMLSRGQGTLLILCATMLLLVPAALVVLLNMPPLEPRERDYVYIIALAGAALPIANAVYQLALIIWNRLRSHVVGYTVALFPPLVLALGGWRAHDRSQDTYPAVVAQTLVQLTPPGGLLLTAGDLWTYPVWHALRAEGAEKSRVATADVKLLGEWWYPRQGMGGVQTPSNAEIPPTCFVIPAYRDTATLEQARHATNADGSEYRYLATNNLRLSRRTLHLTTPALTPADQLLLRLLHDGRPALFAPGALTDGLGLEPYIARVGGLAFLLPDSAPATHLHEHTLRLLEAAFNASGRGAGAPNSDELELLEALGLRHIANAVADSALANADPQAALHALGCALQWLPPSRTPTDTATYHSLSLLHRCGEARLARRLLAEGITRLCQSLEAAADIERQWPGQGATIAARLLDPMKAAIQAANDTGNDDLAMALADFHAR